jgi:hypothetical protein
MWSLDQMGTRLNWERAALDRRPKRSLKDEQEFIERGFTTKWLAKAEEREAYRKEWHRKHTKRRKP